MFLAAIALAVMVPTVVVWQTRVPKIEAVVVRPFANETGQEWLAGAVSEEIGEALARVPVRSASPVTAVLDGTVARSGERIRVTAQLSRADGRRYWTRTYERPLPEIAAYVAGSVLPAAKRKAPGRKASPQAFELYLEARHRFRHGEVARSAEAFARAAQVDPGFAAAWAWLSIANEYLVDQGAARPNELLPAARDAAERAVTLAPDLADTHLALGIVKLQYDWDWDGAVREFDRALALSPGDPVATHWRGRWLEAMNRAPAPRLELPNVPRDLEGARGFLAQADQLRAQTYITPVAFVLAAAVAQDTESMFHWLDVAYQERSVQLPYLLRSPALPQSDPRLLEIVRRLKLPTNP